MERVIPVIAREAHGTRVRLESFVARRYQETHGARIQEFMPVLLGLQTPSGRLRGVAGCREAADQGPMFLERYLDQPAEVVLSSRTGRAIERLRVAEVGNLAGSGGSGVWLVTTLAAYLEGAGHEWCVFTATKPLRGVLRRIGVELFDLAPADAVHAGIDRGVWGSYYDQQPRVSAARLEQVLHSARGRDTLRRALENTWLRARIIGNRVSVRGVA